MTRFANLVESERNNSLDKARKWLWALGGLTLLVQSFFFFNAPNELREVYEKELSKQGTTLAKVEALPDADRAEFDKARGEDLAKVRLIYGVGISLGLVFLGCAFMLPRKPLVCVITTLALYIASIAGMAALNPLTLVSGILWKILIIGALVSALKAALAGEREAKEAGRLTASGAL